MYKKNNRLEAQGLKIMPITLLFIGMFIICLSSVSAFNWTQNTLVGFWDFREGSGTTAKDIGMGRNPGTLSGDTTWTTGKIGSSVLFNGRGSVNITYNSTFDLRSNYSIQAWVYANSTDSQMRIMDKSTLTQSNYFLSVNTGGNIEAGYYNVVWNTISSGNGGLPVKTWTHIVFTKNDTVLKLYINGVLNNTINNAGYSVLDTGNIVIGASTNNPNAYFNGSIDEVGIWNRTLNSSEVYELYGSSNGLGFNSTDSTVKNIIVNLVSPIDGIRLTNDESNFTANYISAGYNFTNATYHVWYSNSTLLNKTTLNITGQSSNTTNLFIDNFDISNYTWNVLTCGTNNTGTKCNFASNNYSFSVGFNVINNTYSTSTYETSYETFQSVIDYNPDSIVSTSLVYDGVSYPASTSTNNNYLTVRRSIDIPTGTGNKTFYWHSTFYSGATYNSQISYQYVNLLNMTGTCSATTSITAVNYSTFSETFLTKITPFKFYSTVNYWLGSGSVKKTLSINSPSVGEQHFCIEPINMTIYMTGLIDYENLTAGYGKRSYYIYNETLNNTIRHVPLYLLETDQSTSFIQSVLDRNLVAVQDAYIYVYRYYPGTDEYILVQSSKTDENGKTIGFYKTETVDYKHKIYLNGVLQLETNISRIVPEETPYKLTFTIGESFSLPWSSFEEDENINTLLVYSNNSGIVTYQFSDSSNTITGGRLLVTLDRTSESELVICNSSLSGVFGTIVCNVNGYNGTVIARGYIDNEVKELISFYVGSSDDARDVFGLDGLIIGAMLILTTFFAFIWNPTAGIVMTNVSVILIKAIGIISFSPVWIFGLLAISITLIILMESQ